jgi:nucleoside-diphosphate-sugar epimerase
MNVLITGANGFLGHNLISALARRDVTAIRALVLPGEDATALARRGIEIFRGDVCEASTLAPAFEGIDVVFHLAGLMGGWWPAQRYFAVNETGTVNVCRSAMAAGIRRIIHVSSWTVYGMGWKGEVEETFPLRPMPEPYSESKAAGDKAVQHLIFAEGLPAVIVRPGTMFGVGDRVNFSRMADRVRDGKGIIVGPGRNAMPLVHVSDVVQGLILASERDRAVGQAYNIGSDDPVTQLGLLSAIAEEIGVNLRPIHVPYHPLYAAAVVAERIAILMRSKKDPLVTRHGVSLFGTVNRHSIRKAREELGYAPRVGIRAGIREAAQWYRRGTEGAVTAQIAGGRGLPASDQRAQ